MTPIDETMMMRALALAMKGRVTAPPNPWVGCVIVRGGEIVGEGFHFAAGQPHAEPNALRQAGDKAAGATAYVTLEPCSHYGRTPPCSLALIKANVARVVVGLQDPDARVSGNGIQQLREAGIEVVAGVCEDMIAKALTPYLHHRRTGRPYCIAKAAISIDGRIAAQDGTSQWISSPEALLDTHLLRAESQAILIGAGTARIDQPKLTVRDVPIFPVHPPLRVILDAKGTVLPPGPLFDLALAPTLIVTTDGCSKKNRKVWEESGVEVAVVKPGLNAQGVDLDQTLDLLGKRGILQLMIEGGGLVIGAFLQSKLLQRLRVYVGPRILGNTGLPLFGAATFTTIADAPCLEFLEAKTFGHTVRIEYGVNNANIF